MDDDGDKRSRTTTASRLSITSASSGVKDVIKKLIQSSPKAFKGFVKLLHVPYLPPISQHGKRGWLVRYIAGPYDVVSSESSYATSSSYAILLT